MSARTELLEDVSKAIAGVYEGSYDLARTGVVSYMTDDILICVLEQLGTIDEQADASIDRVSDERRRFQQTHEAEFSAAVEGLTGRRVRTFLSANHVAQGIAAEIFFLEPAAA